MTRRIPRETLRRQRARERGVALIMVMAAMAVLTVMLAELQDDAASEVASATSDRDSVQAEYLARSAVNLSRLLISAEPTVRQAIMPLFMLMRRSPPQIPVWEYSDRILGAFNDKESSQAFTQTTGLDLSLGKNLGLKGGSFEVKIVDEDRMINANLGASNDIAHIRLAKQLIGLLGPPQYNSMFEQRDSAGQFHDRFEVCRAIIDWADMDDRAFSCDLSGNAQTSGGVEDGYYQLLPKPYPRKNAPFDSLEELHMVRGVSDDFWATFVDPQPERPEKRIVTVWGQGAVNVNSANAQTLLGITCAGAPQAEICTDITQAQLFITGVTLAHGITMGAPLFGNAGDFIAMMKGEGMLGPLLKASGMKPVKFQSESEFAKSITTESKVFSIYAVGVVKGYKREIRTKIHAVVDFRNAPPPGYPMMPGSTSSTMPGLPPAPATTGPTQGVAGGGQLSADAIVSALRPNSGGQMLHYRIE